MLTLNIEDVKANARKAHAEGRLIAQQPASTELCWQNDQGHVCALGASFPKGWNPDPGIFELIQQGEIQTDDEAGLFEMQLTHDHWALGIGTEEDFLNAIAA